MNRAMFVRSTGSGPGHRGGPRRIRPLGRLLALVGSVVAFALLLLLSPASQVHGDYDDDEGGGHRQPRQQCASCPGAAAPASAPTALGTGTGNGCGEEYLGLMSGVHWYDVWKICRANETCYGAIFEGEPFDDNDLYICSPSGQSCPLSECNNSQLRALREDPLQESLADRAEMFTPNAKGPDPKNLRAVDFGYARIKGTDLYFKLLTVTTSYAKETVKVRRIGVELDERTLQGGDTVWDAEWSPNDPAAGTPSTGSTVEHYIDVIIPELPYERFHVTTMTEVEHDEQ